MKSIIKLTWAAAGIAASIVTPAMANEGGFGAVGKPGAFIGSSASVPSPGVYMFNQVFSFQSNFAGPGVNSAFGGNTKVGAQAAVDVQGFLWVPGWTFLGATYDAVLVQPFIMASVGSPVNFQASGVHNTYFVPAELSWKLGDSGFGVKTGLGFWAPTGTIQGTNGLGNIGNPWWTFVPELIVSYQNDGWNFSAALSAEINTKNTITNYTSGSIMKADFTATKTIGNWTFGPVAYYYGQVSDDSCPVGCTVAGGTTRNASRYDVWAAGGLVAYNFGKATLQVWATQEISAKASNPATFAATGTDVSIIPQGSTVFATLSYQLWAPDAPASTAKMYRK
jgi:hypothetical protein